MKPQRIQRQHTKGWRMPDGAVYVGRPSKWGNPFRIGERVGRSSPLFPYLLRTVPGGGHGFGDITPLANRAVIDAYCWWLYEQPHLMVSLSELAGRDLVCWCDLFTECHADILLDLANDGAA